MAVEMPARVEAAAGAEVVAFPWAEASSVLAAIADAATTLSSSLESRVAIWESISDWEGTFRQVFNETYLRLAGAAIDLVERAPGRAQSIVNAADDANTDQTGANEAAEAATSSLSWLPL